VRSPKRSPQVRAALTGTSGVGKSTLLHILGLLDRPSEGTVTIDGASAWDLSLAERALIRNQRIGFVFQAFHLLPALSVLENIELPMNLAGLRRPHSHQRAVALAEQLGGEFTITSRPSEGTEATIELPASAGGRRGE